MKSHNSWDRISELTIGRVTTRALPLSLPSLVQLPPELLSQIVSYLPTANTLCCLSRTCRRLHDFVEHEGWKIFVRHRFPSIQIPPFWKEGSHALTTLSRNLDRRAFLAHDLEPRTKIYRLPGGEVTTKWNLPAGQTMGFQAVLDSAEEWPESSWASRTEVAVWGAGAELVVRTIRRGKEILKEWHRSSNQTRKNEFDDLRCKYEWLVFRNPLHSEGRDDITSVNLLRQSGTSLRDVKHVVVGRASGELNLLQLSSSKNRFSEKVFDTGLAAVRSTDVEGTSESLLIAGLGDERAVLYSLDEKNHQSEPLSEVLCVDEKELACRTWSSRFISADKIAIGRGPSKTLVHVYSVLPEGFSREPVRKFGSGRRESAKTTSAYPIMPLQEVKAGPSSEAMFLSGGYDGVIRLHDMRSPDDCVAFLTDEVDDSAIFSLTTFGRERIIAGAARNSLIKVFDLRMAGGRAYSYLDVDQITKRDALATCNETCKDPMQCSGWNIFASQNAHSQRSRNRSRQFLDGPLYSLSRPSASSTSLYAGLENRVVHFNFTSMLDEYPDPTFRYSKRYRSDRTFDPLATWWQKPTTYLNLAMYERGQGQPSIFTQRGPTLSPSHADRLLYDARWQSL